MLLVCFLVYDTSFTDFEFHESGLGIIFDTLILAGHGNHHEGAAVI